MNVVEFKVKLAQRLLASPIFKNTSGGEFIRDAVIDIVLEYPTADVVEVVRCKDCKFYKAYDTPVEDFDGFCTVNENEYDKDFFCQYGDRSEDTE